MSFAAEMIVPRVVEDDFGRVVEARSTFLRYELRLSYVPPEPSSLTRMSAISLDHESLTYIRLGDASDHIRWPHSKANFRDDVLVQRKFGTAFISTSVEDGYSVIKVHQDGGSRGQPRSSPAIRAQRTIVGTTNSVEDPTILAARREMQQWRLLALEPTSMRAPDSYTDPGRIGPDGSHLAATLFRMVSEQSENVYGDVAAEASALVDVREVKVDADPHRETLTLQARIGNGPILPARGLSDGILRFLALCIISGDPEFGGVLCMEEPENGIHPAKIPAMVDLVRDLAVDPQFPPGSDNPMRQVIVNTHSPYYVQMQNPNDLLLAMPAAVRRNGNTTLTTRYLPLDDTWRTSKLGITGVSLQTILDYLREPDNAPLRLPFEWNERLATTGN